MKNRIEKQLFGLALPVLLFVLVGFGCTREEVKPFLDGFYGTSTHTYVIDNAYDDATSIMITAKWNEEGKVALSSGLIPRSDVKSNSGIYFDMPPSEYSLEDRTIAPTNRKVKTLGIYYDAKAIIHLSEVAIPISLCCVYCPGTSGCTPVYYQGNHDIILSCSSGPAQCHCRTVICADPSKQYNEYVLFIQANEVSK